MARKRKTLDDAPITILPPYANIRGWCELTGLSQTRTYDLLAAGALRAKKLGGATLIDVPHGVRFIKSLPDWVPQIDRHHAVSAVAPQSCGRADVPVAIAPVESPALGRAAPVG